MNRFDVAVQSVVQHVRRPPGLVARTRWLFTLLVVASTLLVLTSLTQVEQPVLVLVDAGAFAGLFAAWGYRYLSGRAPVLLGFVEAMLVAATVIGSVDPTAAFGYLFASLWLRALYGTARGALLHTMFVAVAVLVGIGVWAQLPEHADGSATAVPLNAVAQILQMFLTVGVALYLVNNLFAREQSHRRDTALRQLGDILMSVHERESIMLAASGCLREICAATPSLRALVVFVVDGRVRVADQAGGGGPALETLPASALPEHRDLGAQPVPDTASLAGIGPAGSTWRALPLADREAGWILLGAAPRVPQEAELAVGSMTNQVALALRNSDALQHLTTQASEDPLTGLANRAAFTAALEAAMAAPDRRVAVLFLDLDDFKLVNDGMGHAAGDELLREVATRLRAGVRSRDLCARIGGDEFAVLLCDPDDATTIGQRLVDLVAAPVPLAGRVAHVGASVGLAFAQEDDTSGEPLVQRADIAMYAAKAKGKNRVQVFDPSLLQEDSGVQFEAELAEVAASGGLVVHYQPIVRVDDGQCIAVEALVRWQHPTRGLLHPAEFVPIAERTGAIVAIGAEVLRRACADAVAWTGPNGPLAVHVNVSAAQLTGPAFVDTVSACLADFGLEPARLVLEITEGMVLDSSTVRQALEVLAGVGVQIAIDDFGTGYSALSTLRMLPLGIVKIDKSFLTPGPSQEADEAVVEAIVALADRLGIQVVVEGVERVDQHAFLRAVGAHAAQGFLHLRPTAAANFEQWLVRQNGAAQDSASVSPMTKRPAPRRGRAAVCRP